MCLSPGRSLRLQRMVFWRMTPTPLHAGRFGHRPRRAAPFRSFGLHVGKLHENARNRQQNRAIQQTLVGRFVTFGTTRDHSESPSISIAN